jgi:hypothetical protein
MSLFEGVELTDEQQAAVQANVTKQYEGYESQKDIQKLKAKNTELITEQREAKRIAAETIAKAAEAEDAAKNASEAAKLEAAKKSGDIEGLTKSFEAQLAEERGRTATEREKTVAMEKMNEDAAINSIVDKMAFELGKESAEVLKPHIKARLRYEDGKTQVTDGNGALTISSLDDLTTEFKNNPAFASVIVGSQAGGGGAPKGDETLGGGAAGGSKSTNANMLAGKIPGFSNLPVN